MKSFIEYVTSEDSLTEFDGRAAFEVLAPIVSACPADAEAIEAAQSVISRMPSEAAVTAMLDWWVVVTTGADPVTAGTFNPPSSVDPSIAERMVEVVHLHVDQPRAAWIDAHRRLLVNLAQLDQRVNLDFYGASKLPGERSAWARVLEHLEPTITSLRDGVEAPLPESSRDIAERGLVEGSVQKGSRRFTEILKRVDELDAVITETVELQHQVEPWSGQTLPELLEVAPEFLVDPDAVLERMIVRGLIVDEAALPADRSIGSSELMVLVGDEFARSDAVDRVRLAKIVDGWLGTVGVELTPSQRVPDLDQLITRIHRIEQRVDELDETGLDTSEIRIHLMDHDLAAAEALVEGRRDEIRTNLRTDEVRRWLEVARSRAQQLGVGSELADRLEEVAEALERGDADAAAELRSRIDSELDSSQRDQSVFLVNSIHSDLERLNAGPDLLVEIDALRDDVSNASRRIDVDGIERARRLRDALIVERLAEARGELASFDDAIAEVDHVVGVDELAEWRERFRSLQDHDQSIGDPPGVDDVTYLHDEAFGLLEEIDERRSIRWTADRGEEELVEHVVNYCTQQMAFARSDILRFYVAIKTKPFVVLAGLTGSGKSTIVRLFAEALGANSKNGRFRRVAVRPDWIDQSEVLGFVNPMKDRFQPGWLAKAVKDANSQPDRIFVVLIDELNLAPVEQYLAEYLSAGEEARAGSDGVVLPLYTDGVEVTNADEWPAALQFPPNLVMVGTVNMDETTRVLSDRVLDRASVIQLSVEVSDDHHGQRRRSVSPWDVPYGEWRRIVRRDPIDVHHDYLVELANRMKSVLRIGVGVRSHIEIERFVANAEGVLSDVDALDIAMLLRIIPKIKGFKRDLADGLVDLAEDFEEVGALRCAAVMRTWLADSTPDDEFLDGTSHLVGLV